MPTNGVIYIAYGEKYAAEAARSAASVKQWMPDLPITLFTDGAGAEPVFDRVVRVTAQPFKTQFKPQCLAQTLYERTLFLDTDTYVCGNLEPLFTLLERFDLAAAHGWQRMNPRDALVLSDVVTGTPLPFAQFNSGVLLYRQSAEARQFFADWETLILRNKALGKARGLARVRDQTALREAIYNSSLRVATLTPEYNCRAGHVGYLEGEVKILHGRGFDAARAAAQLNRSSAQRIFMNLPRSYQVWLRHDIKGHGMNAAERLRTQFAVFLLGRLKT
jgi:hypothetical protein